MNTDPRKKQLGGDIYLELLRVCREGHGVDNPPCMICVAKLLNRYLDVVNAAKMVQTEIYPRDVFVGCDECYTGKCECCRGVQIARILGDALRRLEE